MALKYRLSTLGWYNFEMLIQTLLKTIIGPGVTSFGGTKDSGRDAAFRGKAPFPSKETRWEGRWIFQMKYTELEAVKEEVESKRIVKAFQKEVNEIIKRRRSWPDNYVLITNARLSGTSRDVLGSIISNAGFKGNFHTIEGREICEFLDIYPQIRTSFPQLIALADIEKIINKDLYARSEAFVSDLQPKLNVFVATSQYFKAHDILRKHNFVVLDGPPESGKSFIGAAITLAYACKEFEIFYIREPQEVFRAFSVSHKQLYFADDAVGTITFNPNLGDYWSRELSGILRKLDKQHKLIWTARHYILQEAIDRTKLTELIDNFPGIHEVLVEVGDLTLLEKALILYNHAKQSELSDEAKKLIKEQAIFISEHPNFSPERIRQLVGLVLSEIKGRLSKEEKQRWVQRIDKFLRNPSERFYKAYQEALGPSERLMLLTLLDLGSYTTEDMLRSEYERRISTI